MSERILVVEDEVSLRETLTYILQPQGYQVDSAQDGNDAIQKAGEKDPTNPTRIITVSGGGYRFEG